MKPQPLQGAALVLMLLPTLLISVAYAQDLAALAAVGVGMVALGGLVPPALRYLSPDDEDEAGDPDDTDTDPEDSGEDTR